MFALVFGWGYVYTKVYAPLPAATRQAANIVVDVQQKGTDAVKFYFSGGCKNGKSTTASHLAVQLARGGPLYYVATMIPHDAEDRARIRYHISQRAGLGFQTIECGRNIDRCQLPEQGATVLLDSVTALLGNEMFREDGTYYDCQARVAKQLLAFSQQAANVIFVSDYIFSDATSFSPATQAYRKALAYVDAQLVRACDTVLEISAASMTVHKGTLPLLLEPLAGHGVMELIIGGAAQGKRAYAAQRYGVSPDVFSVCTADAEPDFSARFVCNLEQYVRYCVNHGTRPRADFRPDAVLLCQDFFCGVVPQDPLIRQWREETGRYLACLSRQATQVTRLFCGLPQKLK